MHSIKQNTLQKQQHQDITILNVLPTDYMICVFLQDAASDCPIVPNSDNADAITICIRRQYQHDRLKNVYEVERHCGTINWQDE